MTKSRISRFFATAALIGFSLFGAACSQIDTGNVGVARFAGKTDNNEIPAGLQFTGLSSVSEFTVKEFPITLNDMKPQTSDKLRMADVDLDVYVKANPSLVAETTVKYLGDVAKHKDVAPNGTNDYIAGYGRLGREARETVYRAVAQFPAESIHLKRDEVGAAVVKLLQDELNKSDPGVWTVTSVNVRSLLTDPSIDKAIQEKVRLDQEIIAKQKQEALAIAEGKRLFAEADAQARANERLSQSLTPQLIKLKEIEAQKAFATAGTHTVIMGGSAGALVNVGK